MLKFHSVNEFGVEGFGEPDYRLLKQQFAEAGRGDWVLMPPYPFGPNESLLDLASPPPNPPSLEHPFGTDDRGRDVLVRLAYGFNVSLTFAIVVMLVGESLGVAIGAMLGYFGGTLDILGQRVIEIWSSLPFLYTIIILSSVVVPTYVSGTTAILQPSFWLLVFILAAFEWVSITYYIRGEFYREKARDYVGAAIATGVSERNIIFRHILPNALTPVVSFAPFVIVANISSLVALDFLGSACRLPPPAGGAHQSGHGEPDEMVARPVSTGCAVPHAPPRGLHRRGRARSVRPEGVLAAPMSFRTPLCSTFEGCARFQHGSRCRESGRRHRSQRLSRRSRRPGRRIRVGQERHGVERPAPHSQSAGTDRRRRNHVQGTRSAEAGR